MWFNNVDWSLTNISVDDFAIEIKNGSLDPDDGDFTATPTPTPIVTKKLEFRYHTIGSDKVLQVKNLVKPTNNSFATRDTENDWSTLNWKFKFIRFK